MKSGCGAAGLWRPQLSHHRARSLPAPWTPALTPHRVCTLRWVCVHSSHSLHQYAACRRAFVWANGWNCRLQETGMGGGGISGHDHTPMMLQFNTTAVTMQVTTGREREFKKRAYVIVWHQQEVPTVTHGGAHCRLKYFKPFSCRCPVNCCIEMTRSTCSGRTSSRPSSSFVTT